MKACDECMAVWDCVSQGWTDGEHLISKGVCEDDRNRPTTRSTTRRGVYLAKLNAVKEEVGNKRIEPHTSSANLHRQVGILPIISCC